ncbi:hypothetical protein K0M31_001873 [Melipona bicolor]|uniref:Uncharacterized protein n=1 Tax=Melipona bicolor TaxID=60889 RepID=A0AA40KYA9_9HYME|nr:hypothetical protein K0M31_001873 [Melipona bicolor]
MRINRKGGDYDNRPTWEPENVCGCYGASQEQRQNFRSRDPGSLHQKNDHRAPDIGREQRDKGGRARWTSAGAFPEREGGKSGSAEFRTWMILSLRLKRASDGGSPSRRKGFPPTDGEEEVNFCGKRKLRGNSDAGDADIGESINQRCKRGRADNSRGMRS